MKPEDFIVDEIINLRECDGGYLYVKVKKKNWNTIDLVNFIGRKLNKRVGFAGLKDRNAITTQYVSIYNVSKEMVKRLRIKDVELEPLFYGDKEIKLGDLIGNRFKINMGFKARKIDFIENYFGEQRFSRNNVEIARCIFKKDFKKACELLNHKHVNEHLGLYKNDFIGALKRVDKILLGLIVSSYQSYLFNRYLCDCLRKYKDSYLYDRYVFVKRIKRNIDIPLLSFDFCEFYKDYLRSDGIRYEDLIVRSIPDILPLGDERSMFVSIKDFKVKGNFVEFNLPKGSYATIVMKKLESYLKFDEK